MAVFYASDHAYDRAAERLPFRPDSRDFEAVVNDIIGRLLGESTPALLLRRLPNGRELWAGRLRGHACRLVYEPTIAAVITVMA